jgi:hypothetical protein
MNAQILVGLVSFLSVFGYWRRALSPLTWPLVRCAGLRPQGARDGSTRSTRDPGICKSFPPVVRP